MEIIARVRCDFPAKFGLPRQSALAKEIGALIVFEKEYRVPEALRGLEGYSHLWIIWGFHQAERENWSPTVRPPKLGGNERVGVFASRSPFRPNPIGLSCVKLEEIVKTKNEGLALRISGCDMADGTPVYDIKPYLPYTDCHPEAVGGFADDHVTDGVQVDFPPELLEILPAQKRPALLCALARDPRPGYQTDESRVYGFAYAGLNVRFTVKDNVLRVCGVAPEDT